ncbi:MAG: hypothetical protein OXC40_05915 [Proteobacteria bacterium]|nr:hypothetical protein [Pseudomonadota bacterium]
MNTSCYKPKSERKQMIVRPESVKIVASGSWRCVHNELYSLCHSYHLFSDQRRSKSQRKFIMIFYSDVIAYHTKGTGVRE